MHPVRNLRGSGAGVNGAATPAFARTAA
jgi:hypothetical protein